VGYLAGNTVNTQDKLHFKSAGIRPIALVLPLACLMIQPITLASDQVAVRFGLCDASAGVAISDRAFVVADDETNILRIYNVAGGQTPVQELDLDKSLDVDPKEPEVDIEGAARIGDVVYWISSHARNKNGKFRESRHRFFATRVTGRGAEARLEVAGRVVMDLQRAILTLPEAREHQFSKAATLAPKEFGAFNIEGLAAGPGGSLWIGLRNPVPKGRAMLLRLLNPAEMVFKGEAPRFGPSAHLDLGGLGVRDLLADGERLLIVAGAHDGGGKSKLYAWDGGPGQPAQLQTQLPTGFNPEAILSLPGKPGAYLLLSDDGSKRVDGQECKTLPSAQRSFRSVEIVLR